MESCLSGSDCDIITGYRRTHDDGRRGVVVRTRIQLTQEQAPALNGMGALRGVPMSELIRDEYYDS